MLARRPRNLFGPLKSLLVIRMQRDWDEMHAALHALVRHLFDEGGSVDGQIVQPQSNRVQVPAMLGILPARRNLHFIQIRETRVISRCDPRSLCCVLLDLSMTD